jgi:hypothetical protein
MVVLTTPFQQTLAQGQIGEGLIACYLRKRGWTILPVYEKEIDNHKGPRLFLPYGETELIAPDLLGMKGQQIRWFEAKSKGTATFYRKKWEWQTGIDKRLYCHYKQVQELTTWPVWLLFLQHNTVANNAPVDADPCPTGLYGCPINQQYSNEGYYDTPGKRHNMVYWSIADLRKLAPLVDVLSASEYHVSQKKGA